MLRALAAELSDPGRFSRAKAYARDDAVTDIAVEPGLVRGDVQGSRYEPYIAMLYVHPLEPTEAEAAAAGTATAVQLLPDRDEIAVSCSCPDADLPGAVCKHALAVLLVFADEVSIEPELLVRWRSGTALGRPSVGAARSPAATAGRTAPTVVDVLASRLRAPGPRPGRPEVGPTRPVPVTDQFSEVLVSSLAAIRRRP